MPKPGVLESLSEGQQAQLLTWLETLTPTEVLAKLNAPPPEGFSVRTHLTSLRRFQARHNRELLSELLEPRSASSRQSGQMLYSAQDQLLQHALHVVSTSPSTSPALSAAAKIVSAHQDHALRVRELEYRERIVRLAEERLHLERLTAAANLILKEARLGHNHASARINEVAAQIVGPVSAPPPTQPHAATAPPGSERSAEIPSPHGGEQGRAETSGDDPQAPSKDQFPPQD